MSRTVPAAWSAYLRAAAQRGSWWLVSSSSSACSVCRCSASSGARNSFSTFFEIARSPARASLPARREADELAAAVGLVAPALDEALLLELVEEADEMAAVVAERVGDLALRLAHALVEQ